MDVGIVLESLCLQRRRLRYKPIIKEEDGCLGKVFDKDSEEGFDDDLDYKDSEKEGEVDDEDDGEQRKGKNEPHKLPDGFYVVEALRKKRVRQRKPIVTKKNVSVAAKVGKIKECSKKILQQQDSSVITRSKSVYYLEPQIPGHGFPKAGLQSAVVPLTGAKKRKSGPTKRFISVASTTNEIVKDDFEDMYYCITEIVKVASHDTGLPGGEINFMVKRHNGKHMYLNNKFLKESYPRLLIKFYEKQISK
nr:chromo domain protein LHP1-like [Ipomoea trifida]